MRGSKYLLIILLLVFISGCSIRSGVVKVNKSVPRLTEPTKAASVAQPSVTSGPTASSNVGNQFTLLENGNILASNGTEYALLNYNINKTLIDPFGSTAFLGTIKSTEPPMDIYSLEGDPGLRILQVFYDREEAYYYRKTSLPVLDLSVENCIRVELTRDDELQKGVYVPDIKHMSNNVGIKGKSEIETFLTDVKSQKTIDTDSSQSQHLKFETKGSYVLGHIYGYFQGEANIALVIGGVWSYNDKSYSIWLYENGKEYVMPAKWVAELTAK